MSNGSQNPWKLLTFYPSGSNHGIYTPAAPWKPELWEGEANDRRDNSLANLRVEVKALGLSC